MKIEDARYVRVGGYPALDLRVDGVATRILPAERAALWDLGLVYLGPAFEDRVPEREYVSPAGTATTLRGFTDDRRLFLMHARLSQAAADGTFRPGPVPVPGPGDV